MQSKNSRFPVDGHKKAIIAALFILSFAICVSGAFFCIYSITYKVYFQVMDMEIPGVVFGIAVLYLGIRYAIKLFRLKDELYKPTSRFSWDNFKAKKQ